MKGIEYPVKLADIKTFEKRSGVSVNVYGYDDHMTIFPLLVTDNERDRHVNLLYTKNGEETHFCYIKNLSRLISSQISKHEKRTWLCNRCLLHFTSEDKLNRHSADCKKHEAVKIKLPAAGKNRIEFKDYNQSMRVPFVCYADFESLLTSIATCQPPPATSDGQKKPYTMCYQRHKAVSFSYYIVHDNGYYKEPVEYFGQDAAQQFIKKLKEEAVTLKMMYSTVVPMAPLTTEQNQEYLQAMRCHICQKELGVDRVRDHDHFTGMYRGPAHQQCNLNYQKPDFLPVFIHNLAGYDTHLFIKALGVEKEQITLIPNNEERYISFTVNVTNGLKLRFLDSYKFIGKSLDELTKNLSREQFTHTIKQFSDDVLDLVLRKGVYPYDYMSNMERFDESALPSQSAFYNKLNKCPVEIDDYQHACKVWDAFNIQTMKEYTMLYNKTDVLLLADVMENFRNVCLQTYRLDPAWYFTAPGLAWSAMLKITGISLELLNDYDQILMVGKAIRGGISQCSKRYASANNKYMTDDYNPQETTTYLAHLDANNLYGWAMSQCMPYGGFQWCDTNIDVRDIPDDAETGYFLEVDLEYPQELHDTHSDFPLAPEHRTPPGSKQSKLLATLKDKEKYVLHYRNLKLYLSLGMRLKQIHRVLSFKQSDWMKVYIDLNTEMRTLATNAFEKDFYKLMNNAVFGKTMENIRNRVNIRLVTDKNRLNKLIAKPNFKSRTIFTEHLAAVHMRKLQLLFNKPIYVGASVLDVSKTLMYEFHYKVMKAKYGDNITVLYTDTDSLIYYIITEDFYADMQQMIEHFDTSDYPEPNDYGIPRVNKKVLGKMKDELSGRIMLKFAGLRSKMYATNVKDGVSAKKSKGVKRSVVEQELTFDDYEKCLFDNMVLYKKMNQIRSFKHDLYSVEINKKSLSPDDDKRCVLEDGVTTLAWGHYKITNDDDDDTHY